MVPPLTALAVFVFIFATIITVIASLVSQGIWWIGLIIMGGAVALGMLEGILIPSIMLVMEVIDWIKAKKAKDADEVKHCKVEIKEALENYFLVIVLPGMVVWGAGMVVWETIEDVWEWIRERISKIKSQKMTQV